MGFNFVEAELSDDLLSHEKARLKGSEAGFAKTDKVNFAKTNVLIGLSDDLERKMVYKTEKIFHSI